MEQTRQFHTQGMHRCGGGDGDGHGQIAAEHDPGCVFAERTETVRTPPLHELGELTTTQHLDPLQTRIHRERDGPTDHGLRNPSPSLGGQHGDPAQRGDLSVVGNQQATDQALTIEGAHPPALCQGPLHIGTRVGEGVGGWVDATTGGESGPDDAQHPGDVCCGGQSHLDDLGHGGQILTPFPSVAAIPAIATPPGAATATSARTAPLLGPGGDQCLVVALRHGSSHAGPGARE